MATIDEILDLDAIEVDEPSEQAPKATLEVSTNMEVIDTTATEVVPFESKELVPASPPASQEEDYQLARKTMIDTMKKTAESMNDLITIAKDSEHPRAYEVLADFARTITDMGERIVRMNDDHAERSKEKQEGPENVTNNLFVGSTAELLDLLKKKRVINNQ